MTQNLFAHAGSENGVPKACRFYLCVECVGILEFWKGSLNDGRDVDDLALHEVLTRKPLAPSCRPISSNLFSFFWTFVQFVQRSNGSDT